MVARFLAAAQMGEGMMPCPYPHIHYTLTDLCVCVVREPQGAEAKHNLVVRVARPQTVEVVLHREPSTRGGRAGE